MKFAIRRQPCPACLDRGDLDIVGRSRRKDGERVNWSCEFCKGSGKAEAWPDYKYRPPKIHWFGHDDD